MIAAIEVNIRGSGKNWARARQRTFARLHPWLHGEGASPGVTSGSHACAGCAGTCGRRARLHTAQARRFDFWVALNDCGLGILDGVTIGDGCVIAAGAVVTRPVPPYSVAAGVPARVLRERQSHADHQ